MTLCLANGVHAVQVGSDLVFLSRGNDAYFCLPLDPGAIDLNGDHIVAHLPGLAQALCESGLVAPATAERTPRPSGPPTVPTRTARRLIDDQIRTIDRRPRLRHLRALGVAARAAMRGRDRPISDLVRIEGRRAQAEPSPRLLADLTVYRRLTPWLPIDGLCLFRSHMLLRYLNALGHGARWVFGVRTWPFRAHCWLQVGDVALDDEAERLSAYAPIMAV
ncbi:MAG: lasso peptide biosynthesis protein [Caulobacter sp.]|nr:lasso peptide biosynthesis protein [Caulobacter sp.]